MSLNWNIKSDWKPLNEGPEEDRAAFGQLTIRAYHQGLTEGYDGLTKEFRSGPIVSIYAFAEWIAWNWWRLRWEPRARSHDWEYAHQITAIGGGYIWPDIRIFSDGERIALIAKSSLETPTSPFRYINNFGAVLSATEFESEIDQFMKLVANQLTGVGIKESNFQTVWASVLKERSSPIEAHKRKLEALLGLEPDEASDEALSKLMADEKEFSSFAVEELAAERGRTGGNIVSGQDLRETAKSYGFDLNVRDSVSLRLTKPQTTQTAAWKIGAEAARKLRMDQGFGQDPISSDHLAEMAGASLRVLNEESVKPRISFVVDVKDRQSKVMLRNSHPEARRFELARLLGDRLIYGAQKLSPATRAYTYRQKVQRAFAAELLSPFDAVDPIFDGEYESEDKIEEAKQHFAVSDYTIRTVLMNHGKLDRENLSDVPHAGSQSSAKSEGFLA